MTTLNDNQALTVSHADASRVENDGPHAFLENRELGNRGTTDDRVDAHLVRAIPGRQPDAKWHTHDINLEMVFVTHDRAVYEYDGEGKHSAQACPCVLQSTAIRRRELLRSDHLERIEIVSSANFSTTEA